MVTAVKKRRGLRQEQADLSRSMRAAGKTWVEIAAVFRERYGVNARTALRLVRGWSQPEAAEQWTRRWPDDPKTLKNISYWENWPSSTGREPSLPVLGRLAELYECAVTDLIVDGPDHRHLDAAHGARERAAPMPVLDELTTGLDPILDRLADTDIERIAGIGLVWAQRLRPLGYAYGVLMKLSAGLALAATAHSGLRGVPDPDGADRDGDLPVRVPRRPWPTGIWRMRYQEGGSAAEHQVVLREHRGRLLGQSLPQPGGARVRLDLEVDAAVVTGAWVEHSGTGRSAYRTLQLTLAPSRLSMRGRWLGFDAAARVSGGEWELRYLEESVTGGALRAYRGTAA